MAAMSTSAFAQADVVKQAQKLLDKGELEQAEQTITPALSNGTAEEKADAWNVLSNIKYQIFAKNQQAEVENKLKKTNNPYDTLGMNKAAIEAFEAALKCDEFDAQPNEKGKVKTRYRANNSKTWQVARLNVINSGMYFYNHKNLPDAIRAWKLYVDSPEQPLFTGVDLSKDEYRSEVSYYTALAAYNSKDYATATKYAKIAAQDTAKAKDANEIILFAQKEGAKTKEDSLAYLNTVKELRAQNPNEERYYNLLMAYYSEPGRQQEMYAWVNEEITKNPNNKMSWALKGEVEMNQDKWDDAIASYKKAAEIDPEFVPVIFNIGVCLNKKAVALNDKLADKKTGMLTTANANKVKAALNEALPYLEKTRELDPNREKVDWAYPLYQIYYSLKDNAKAAEMEKLLKK